MDFKDFEIHASPFFAKVYCPKHRNCMIELNNGWFSKVWYCEECQFPYQIKMVKMRTYDEKVLKELLEEKRKKTEKLKS